MTVRVQQPWMRFLLHGTLATLLVAGLPAGTSDPAPTPDSGLTLGDTEVTIPAPPGVTFTGLSLGTLHPLALGSDGAAYAWGHNGSGQLGAQKASGSNVPLRVPTPEGLTFTQLEAGGEFSVGLTADGSVYSWGANGEGQLGNGTRNASTVPTRMELPGDVRASQVVAGEYYTLALGKDGAIYGWGKDDKSQLGDGGYGFGTRRLLPVRAEAPEGVEFSAISAGSYHSHALSVSGAPYGWGDNSNGQIGNGSRIDAPYPTPVSTPSDVEFTEVHAGGNFSVAVGDDDSIYAWGPITMGSWAAPRALRTHYYPFGSHCPRGSTSLP